jgi:GNAT superfamily N-acetyltransferase
VPIINASLPAIEIRQAETGPDIAAARELFREYEAWLGMDLCFQGFEQELDTLPGKYAAPAGRLLLASVDNILAGCAALRPLSPGVCEMKRLFVRGEFRSHGLGRLLIRQLIAEARSIGYGAMRLDTYPAKMAKAVELYRSHGFTEISPYYDNPHEGVLFMELALTK